MLKRPDYVEYEYDIITALYCKCCGDQIAGLIPCSVGGGKMINTKVLKFRRFQNYVDIKFKFNDGSFHVTNCCRSCAVRLDPSTMLEMYQADWPTAGIIPDARVPVAVVEIDNTGVGII